jgi:uncharacterized membrane protein YozB (DUF420 family)
MMDIQIVAQIFIYTAFVLYWTAYSVAKLDKKSVIHHYIGVIGFIIDVIGTGLLEYGIRGGFIQTDSSIILVAIHVALSIFVAPVFLWICCTGWKDSPDHEIAVPLFLTLIVAVNVTGIMILY